MARYTDIDRLINEYDRVHIGPPGGARKLMEDAPTTGIFEVDPKKQKLIIRFRCLLKEEAMAKIREYILWQYENGVIAIPNTCDVYILDKDDEFKIEVV